VLRIGHLGALNELEVLATLAGLEMALFECGVPLTLGSGVAACQRVYTPPPFQPLSRPAQAAMEPTG